MGNGVGPRRFDDIIFAGARSLCDYAQFEVCIYFMAGRRMSPPLKPPDAFLNARAFVDWPQDCQRACAECWLNRAGRAVVK